MTDREKHIFRYAFFHGVWMGIVTGSFAVGAAWAIYVAIA